MARVARGPEWSDTGPVHELHAMHYSVDIFGSFLPSVRSIGEYGLGLLDEDEEEKNKTIVVSNHSARHDMR